ncbi:tripartite tricarboxylate transporter TctB family protein [Metabacillus litoralis]|jgi:putative tricarboxylic transport membrane protein|uniref:tripartite tricarboxylate transporter TctB family protein n=1 Tax=Metabacillus litoralis TaxID=152268 RepID=UPI00203CF9DA|nr:tripartite tricarboxylate transporter TctB family protein [Metabacillus litoralis]MCM3653339.1 tripartite tricarboxylate transporter TctB family protein [Metabacillus litoralis]
MKLVRSEILVAVIIFLVAFIFLIQSLSLPYNSEIGPGPGFFPLWLSGILLIVSCIYIYQAIKKVKEKEEFQWFSDKQALKKILYILGTLILFVLLISFLGFLFTSTIFLFLLLVKEYKWYKSLMISIIVTLIVYWVFGTLLDVALPVSVFGW